MNVPMLKQYPVWLGLALAIVMHFIGGGWWLDTNDRVVNTSGALAVLAFGVGALWPKRTWLPALHLWIGFMAGMAAILFIIGPGNIFPIVLTIGGGWAGMAVILGFGPGALVRMAVGAVVRKAHRVRLVL
jgi:hypothetical protein